MPAMWIAPTCAESVPAMWIAPACSMPVPAMWIGTTRAAAPSRIATRFTTSLGIGY